MYGVGVCVGVVMYNRQYLNVAGLDNAVRLHVDIFAFVDKVEDKQVLRVVLPAQVQEDGEEDLRADVHRAGGAAGNRGHLHPADAVRARSLPRGAVVSQRLGSFLCRGKIKDDVKLSRMFVEIEKKNLEVSLEIEKLVYVIVEASKAYNNMHEDKSKEKSFL